MESKDYSVKNTPIDNTSYNSNVTSKKSSEDSFVKNDPTLERTKSLSSKIAIDSYQVDDLESHSVEKSNSHVDSSVLKFKEVNGQTQQHSIFDNSDEAIDRQIREAREYVSPDWGYAVDSESSKDGYGIDSNKDSNDGYAIDSNNAPIETKVEIPKMQKIPKTRSALQTQTKEQKDDSRLTHLFEVCSSSLVSGPNILNPDFKTPEKHKLYTDTVVTIINTSQDKDGVVKKLGAGFNKTTFALKSFALTSGSTENKFLQTELTLAKKIKEMELKGAVKTYGIMESGNNFIIVSKKADMGTMRDSKIDDEKGLSLLLDAHANIKEFHDAGISHNDIKLSNFLVHKGSKENERILLNDFGSSIIGAKKEGPRMASTYVLDPYTLRNMDTVNIKSYPDSDKYAYGLAVIEFLRRNSNAPIDTESVDLDIQNRFAPWVNNNQMTDEECASFVNNLIENTPIPRQVPELHDLLKSLMAFNPNDRPTNDVIQRSIAEIKAKLA